MIQEALKNYRKWEAKKIAWILLIVVIIFKFTLIVWQFAENNYLVAPGGDPLTHLNYIKNILEGKPNNFSSYPPLYHYIIAFFVRLSGADTLQVIKVFSIILLFLPIVVIYQFTKTFFGFWSAFWATIIFTLATSSPLLTFADGNYPDLLNYGVFIPFFFLFFIRALKEKLFPNIILALFFFFLMVLTHHFTTTFTILIVIIYLTSIGVWSKFYPDDTKSSFPNYLPVLLYFVVFSFVGYLLIRISFGPFLQSAIASSLSLNSPIGNHFFSEPISYDDFSHTLPPLIEYIGIFGLMSTMATIRYNAAPKLLIVVWVLTLFLLSRTPLSGLAPRYLRELSLPLSILCGIFIYYFVHWSESNFQKIGFAGLFGFIIYTGIVQLNVGPFLIAKGGFSNMVWYRKVDQEKVEYFKTELPKNVTILANPSNPYINYYMSFDNPNNITYTPLQEVPLDVKKTMDPLGIKISILDTLNVHGASYVFVGAKPAPLDEEVYPEYKNYNKATAYLLEYTHNKNKIVKTFEDGSQLFVVDEK